MPFFMIMFDYIYATNMKTRLYLTIVAIFCASLAQGQRYQLNFLPTHYTDDPLDELTYTSYGINMISNNVYGGRKDSMGMPYIGGYISHTIANGFYGKFSFNYAPNGRNGRFDKWSGELGYDRTFGYHWLTGAWYEYNKYYEHSTNPMVGYTGVFGLYGTYRNKSVEPYFSYVSYSGKASDYAITLGISHNMRYRDNTLNIYPSLVLNFGSTNFYSYFMKNKYFVYNHADVNTATIITDGGNLKGLNAEFSAKTRWINGDFMYTFKPAWIIPLSTEKIMAQPKPFTETLKTSLVLELDVCYRHERK